MNRSNYSLYAWLKQKLCEHFWRPALTTLGPAKYCDYCNKTEQLTEANFYALFGRMPIL